MFWIVRIRQFAVIWFIVAFCGVKASAVAETRCIDADRDGYFGSYPAFECPQANDCYDFDSRAHPGGTEILCDGVDQNCDGVIDCGCQDKDRDLDFGYDPVSCPGGHDKNDSDPVRYSGAVENCNGIDDNFNGAVDEQCVEIDLLHFQDFEYPADGTVNYYDDVGKGRSKPNSGYQTLDISTDAFTTGTHSFKHVFDGAKTGFAGSVSLINFISDQRRFGKGFLERDILAKAQPYTLVDIKITEMSKATIFFEGIQFSAPTNGWITIPLNYRTPFRFGKGESSAQHQGIAALGVEVRAAGGASNLSSSRIVFYMDNLRTYGDKRNTRWTKRAQSIGFGRDRGELYETDAELSAIISSSSPVLSPSQLSVARGEPEHFSIEFASGLTLTGVNAAVGAFAGETSGKSFPAEAFRLKWLTNKNGKLGYYGFEYSEAFLLNDPNLVKTEARADAPALRSISLPHAYTSKLWLSIETPADVPPDRYSGSIRVTHGSGAIDVPLVITVLDVKLADQAPVKGGIYAKSEAKELPDQLLRWLKKAGISDITIGYPNQHMRGKTYESFKSTYADDLFESWQRLKTFGINDSRVITMSTGSYELWRYLWEDADKYHLYKKFAGQNDTSPAWIGKSLEVKLDYQKSKFAGQQVEHYIYNWDETHTDKLQIQIPVMEIVKDRGFKWFAAIHTAEFFNKIRPDKHNTERDPWVHFTSKYGMRIGDHIDFWIQTDRSYMFNTFLGRLGKLAGSYGYPFTNVKEYTAQRNEFWRTYLAGAHYYFNYALDDTRGPALTHQERWDLISFWNPDNRKQGFVENYGSEGFIRGYWDLRYLQTLIELLEKADRLGVTGAAVSNARDFVDVIDVKKGWRPLKNELIQHILSLKGAFPDTTSPGSPMNLRNVD